MTYVIIYMYNLLKWMELVEQVKSQKARSIKNSRWLIWLQSTKIVNLKCPHLRTVYTHVHIHTRIHTRTHTRTHTHVHTHTQWQYPPTYVCIYIHTPHSHTQTKPVII